MRPHISQSVGTSHSLAKQRGHMNPSLLRMEWQTQNDFGDESGRRVGNPIIIKSEADEPGPFPAAR